ncbi:MAG: hypothetical protein AAF126_15910 [Chloroflexota bacterium]
MTSKQWLCPLCAVKRIKYGTSCNEHPDCGNQLNINGRWYAENAGSKDAKGIGISEIANKDTGDE